MDAKTSRLIKKRACTNSSVEPDINSFELLQRCCKASYVMERRNENEMLFLIQNWLSFDQDKSVRQMFFIFFFFSLNGKVWELFGLSKRMKITKSGNMECDYLC